MFTSINSQKLKAYLLIAPCNPALTFIISDIYVPASCDIFYINFNLENAG